MFVLKNDGTLTKLHSIKFQQVFVVKSMRTGTEEPPLREMNKGEGPAPMSELPACDCV